MTDWTPKTWTDPAHPAPYIPVLNGLRQDQYAAALPSFGEHARDGSATRGAGYAERISVVYDPANGNIGVVTQWEWNSAAISYVWTAEGLTRTPHADRWPWDVAEALRHTLAWHAFRDAHRAGTAVGYWDTAPDRATADAAQQEYQSRAGNR
jgi:hypothetical protein